MGRTSGQARGAPAAGPQRGRGARGTVRGLERRRQGQSYLRSHVSLRRPLHRGLRGARPRSGHRARVRRPRVRRDGLLPHYAALLEGLRRAELHHVLRSRLVYGGHSAYALQRAGQTAASQEGGAPLLGFRSRLRAAACGRWLRGGEVLRAYDQESPSRALAAAARRSGDPLARDREEAREPSRLRDRLRAVRPSARAQRLRLRSLGAAQRRGQAPYEPHHRQHAGGRPGARTRPQGGRRRAESVAGGPREGRCASRGRARRGRGRRCRGSRRRRPSLDAAC